MNIIIPMAGLGKRMRPHTLTTPKPLIPVAGKSIVQRLVEDIVAVAGEKVDEIAFIIGDFGNEVEQELIRIAGSMGAKGTIHYQKEALGTAHAILCAAPALKDNVVVAFADTLFFADFKIDPKADAVIWTQHVENPSAFGVVTTNEQGRITAFVEKPQTFVSDQAIIGIYYFRDGGNLKKELQYLVDNHIVRGIEYQLTDALQNMLDKGVAFTTASVDEWLDCGNVEATVQTNQRVLAHHHAKGLISASAKVENSEIIQPCFIGDNVCIKDSKIGPFVSIGNDTNIEKSTIKNSIIQSHSNLKNVACENSMIGNYVTCENTTQKLNLGDYSTIG